MRQIALLIILLIPTLCRAQDDISIGKKYAIRSKILNEKREYWVHLPKNYSNNQYAPAHYPVVYILDGEDGFTPGVAIQQFLSRSLYAHVPEMIIVGVLNTDRTRDLTPSRSSLNRNGKLLYENSGGGDSFFQFLNEELRTHIDTTYRTSDYNILVGHSFGGLFAMHVLVNHTQDFNAYIAIDPSLWWDNKKTFQEAQQVLKSKDFKGINLFIALAHSEEKGEEYIRHTNSIRQFCEEVLPSHPENGLRSAWKYYPEEDHGTVSLPAITDGLRLIFDGICLPVKQIPFNPGLVEKHYQQVSEQIGYALIPSEPLIDNIGKYCLSMGQEDAARQLFQYNLKNYPDSPNARLSLEKTEKKESDVRYERKK